MLSGQSKVTPSCLLPSLPFYIMRDFRYSFILNGGDDMWYCDRAHPRQQNSQKSELPEQKKLCSFSWERLKVVKQWKDECRKMMTNVEKNRDIVD